MNAASLFPASDLTDGRYDRFSGLASGAIICAQIKARFLRFDPGQHQWPAASGAGRPEIVDELKIERVWHGTIRQRLSRPNSESIQSAAGGRAFPAFFY
jgi:hypothetical protein